MRFEIPEDIQSGAEGASGRPGIGITSAWARKSTCHISLPPLPWKVSGLVKVTVMVAVLPPLLRPPMVARMVALLPECRPASQPPEVDWTPQAKTTVNIFWDTCPFEAFQSLPSQRSLHNAPIFRLLLKVAVKGTHQCDFMNFCGTLGSQHHTRTHSTHRRKME